MPLRAATARRVLCAAFPAAGHGVARRRAAAPARAFATTPPRLTPAPAAAQAPGGDKAASAENRCIFGKVALLGAGRMADAMVERLLQTGLMQPERVAVYDVVTEAMQRLVDAHGVQWTNTIAECVEGADLIVYAVKPQNCEKVHEEIQRARSTEGVRINESATVLSVVAGEPVERFVMGTGLRKVVRSMPNTPASIGEGVTVWCCTSEVDAAEREKIKAFLGTFGTAIYVDDESFVDMSTSISGSGPAYIFMLMEAMIDAGVHMGFSRDVAKALVQHTILGSTLYAMKTQEHPAILRNSVTSPAGTTASAVYELENGKFRVVIKDAIWACYRRTLELRGANSNVGPGRMAFTPPFEAPIRVDQPPRSTSIDFAPRGPSGECNYPEEDGRAK
eukprot:TRINITY_DN4163_c0_g1_i4.p1 TRINITY_DN4163_c0_g1~~TRINITY_DN4163_c0_g1_i4.p1  ORF type:complete len:407 (+),score=138.74 TRINITY_DN4163_c0_g1_i4:47-1222(+)